MPATKMRRSGYMDDDIAALSCGALGHPLRVRILEITNERDISPSTFVDEGLEPKGINFTSRAHGLSHVSYHFRELEKAGCVEVVQTHHRRGAVESIYRGRARVEFTTEEFARLPSDQRRMFSRIAMQALIARVDGAVLADTFDSRSDRFMVMAPLALDERGWNEFIDVLDRCYEEVQQVNDDAADRLATSGAEVIPATYGMLGFTSPPAPPAR
jgi:hypothetical protein